MLEKINCLCPENHPINKEIDKYKDTHKYNLETPKSKKNCLKTTKE